MELAEHNMHMKLQTLLLCLLALCIAAPIMAQKQDTLLPVVPYDQPKEYEIGGIRVSGAQYADAGALIAVSSLKVGDKVRIPGANFTKAIQSLWNLKLFTDVQIVLERTIGGVAFIEIVVEELPRYTRHSFKGVKKNKHDDLNGVITKFIQKGAILTENIRSTLKYQLEEYFVEKGYRNATVNLNTFPDEKNINAVRIEFDIKKGKKVKIQNITFDGNTEVKDRVLRKKMKKTVRKSRIFKKSKFIREEFEEDKTKVEAYYSNLGFRDARIFKDSIWRNKKGRILIDMKVDEGRRYYFRNVVWKGNTLYETAYLNQVLGLKKGDPYNQELLQNRLTFSQDGRDISSLYLDNGYLFFRCDPVETAVDGDSIDVELRIFEGPQATIDRVVIKGNDRTHEHVIRRELFTRPGDKFSRSDIIRSQRQIVNLGYFNQEKLGINTPVNPDRGTVDIEYTVEEKPSDQLELSAGYQPPNAFSRRGGVIGTLGVTFNNFSVRNIKNRESWNPLPQGDGQRLSLRGQTAGDRFQSYNASFTEPWLGGRKPNSLTVAGFYNRSAFGFEGTESFSRLEIMQGSVGFGTRLKFPDDNFIFRADLDIQTLRLNNSTGFVDDEGRFVRNGIFHNYSVNLTLARNTINDPIFPKSGSLVSLKTQFTPPYSFFRDENYYKTDDVRKLYGYIEYVKWRFDAEWYTPIVGKLTLRTSTKVGILSRWSDKLSLSPFERYQVGGDGLNNQNFLLNGQEIISMRGYEPTESTSGVTFGNGIMDGITGGAGVFSKYTVEMRYPISLNPQSTIFVMAFAQGGNAWQRVQEFNPFDVRRSVGMGLRVFLPMFGTLGFDYGFGIDKPSVVGKNIFQKYGNFNIVLGFEPD